MEGVSSAQVQAQNKHSHEAWGEMNKWKLGSFVLCVMLITVGFPAEAQQPKKVLRIGYLWREHVHDQSPTAKASTGWQSA